MLLHLLIISHTSKLNDLTEGSPTKEPTFLRRQPRFPREMTNEEQAQMTCQFTDQDIDKSSMWNSRLF